MPRYLSTDPNAGQPARSSSRRYLSTEPDAGDAPAPRTKPYSAEDFMDPPADRGSAVGRFASNAWEMLNPVSLVEGIAGAVRHPIDTGKALVGAQVDQFGKARDAYREGRYSEAAGHAGAGVLPVLGPMAADIGEQAGRGDVAGAAGRLAGVLAPTKLATDAIRRRIPPKALTRPQKAAAAAANAKQADAVKWALDQGIPVDAATATGNRVVRSAKAVSDSSLGGAISGQRAATARADALGRVGRTLADQADALPATAETAGTGVRKGIEGAIMKAAGEADAAYSRVRAAGDAVVDLTQTKAALKPIYDALIRKRELTGQLMGAEGRAAVALDALVGGADNAPLSVVDAALGDIKALARGAEMPELRSAGQGLAAEAVKNLETAVQTTAKAAGVWDDLRAGRDATIAKWGASDVRDLLRAEPVQTFKMLTTSGDAAIDRLRDVKRVAPGEIPKIGRAYLDGLLDMATSEGGFGREAKLWAEWDKLGAETKGLLYPDKALREGLDNFFLVGKKMAENPNPSGSALVGGLTAQGTVALMEPVTGAVTVIGGYGLSKLLNSPATARLLTQGMQTPRTSAAARALAARLKVAIRPAISTAQATRSNTPEASRAPR